MKTTWTDSGSPHFDVPYLTFDSFPNDIIFHETFPS